MSAIPERTLASVEQAVAALRRGHMVVVVDDEDRENEGDLVMAAEFATPEAIAFIVRHTSGVICVALPGDRCDALDLPLMVARNTETHCTAFTTSVDYGPGTTTGISAADRAATIRALAGPATRPGELRRPGHVFPLRALGGGVLSRPGHTEAAVDLLRTAGLRPGGVLCEVVNDDGTMARLPDLQWFCGQHGLLMISIAELARYRRRTERLVTRLDGARLPARGGEFEVVPFVSVVDGHTHLALVAGDPAVDRAPLVRVHSECLTGDVFGSSRCDCGAQLEQSMRAIAAYGSGVVVYLRGHEGRGIGIRNKIAAYRLQDGGADTVDANLALGLPVDGRDYSDAAQILRGLGLTSVRLITNNPEKARSLEEYGITVAETVQLPCRSTPENLRYLETKRDRMGHLLDVVDTGRAPRLVVAGY